MKLVLPYPPSANRYWRNWHGRMVLSDEARQYKRDVGLLSRSKPTSSEVHVELRVFRPRKARDLDNCIKVVLDALNGSAWDDDSQVTRIVAVRYEDKANPRVEVTVEAA